MIFIDTYADWFVSLVFSGVAYDDFSVRDDIVTAGIKRPCVGFDGVVFV